MTGTFSTTMMLAALVSLHRPPRFLLDFFFPNVVMFDDEEVAFDVEEDDLTLAPFVSPVAAGKALKGQGFNTNKFKPAYVKPKHQIDPSRPLVRRPGESIGGNLTAGDRRNLIIMDTMELQRDQIIRRLEWMAASALTTGAVVVAGENYPTANVDFQRTAGHTITLTGGDRWGEAGVSPYDDLDGWMDTVSEAVGAGVNVVVMGKSAWKLLRSDDEFKEALDREKGQSSLIELGYQTGAPGTPQYKGRIGDVEFYTYNGIYKDENGNTQSLLDPYGVIMAATEAHAGRRLHGAILDAGAGYQPYEFYPKMWEEKDPSVEFVMTQSAPLVAPGRPNATLYAKVR